MNHRATYNPAATGWPAGSCNATLWTHTTLTPVSVRRTTTSFTSWKLEVADYLRIPESNRDWSDFPRRYTSSLLSYTNTITCSATHSFTAGVFPATKHRVYARNLDNVWICYIHPPEEPSPPSVFHASILSFKIALSYVASRSRSIRHITASQAAIPQWILLKQLAWFWSLILSIALGSAFIDTALGYRQIGERPVVVDLADAMWQG
ncbi:hypothetical protein K449DRAFT_460258 [Hypoxylon sp. EC38]|nr:hypothetical protein K449DRAFT_460258 [Hypoxylon sp. EC38]